MRQDLNPAQREAVETLSGPLLVLAGAGSGKTRVVTYRIARLIRAGVRPERILAVTFTKKASGEMQERAAALLGKRLNAQPEISTFHSLCVRILRRHAARLGYPPQFAIYDRGDQESLARAALREIRVGDESLRPAELLNHISRWKSHAVRPPEAASLARTDKEHLASAGYRRYQSALRTKGAMDFDDLLLVTEELFSEHADIRREEAERFTHLLIDEYQDTNASQYRIVRALAIGHRNLCVVGDDDQSIYGWRGAEVQHILRFKQDWPEAKVVRLEDNYRSTAAILDLANKLIRYNSQRHDKQLVAARAGGEKPKILQFQDETIEAREIVADIATRVGQEGVEARDFAILFRTNEQPRPFEQELRRLKLPYVIVGGMSFYDRAEVRDVLAYLKLLVNPHDEVALLRIINTPPRGIGKTTIAALVREAVAAGEPLWEALARVKSIEGMTPAAVQAIEKFRAMLGRYAARLKQDSPAARSLVNLANDLIDEIAYRDEINRNYKEPQDQLSRWAAVEEVINAIGAYEQRGKKRGLGGFLDDIAVGDRETDRDKESQLGRNAVVLMTMHSAKGLEFSQVYLVGMEEGILPHHRAVAEEGAAIEEERRLCYVGITRAQDRLTLSLALTRMKWGKARPSDPSRFLFEISGRADNPRAGGGRSARSLGEKKSSTTPAQNQSRVRRS